MCVDDFDRQDTHQIYVRIQMFDNFFATFFLFIEKNPKKIAAPFRWYYIMFDFPSFCRKAQ